MILYCKKWKETVSFYHSLLNLPVITSLDWFVEFRLGDTSCLSLADASRTSIESNGGKGVTITFEVDDIQIARLNLVRMGLKEPAVKDHPWGARVIHVHDPEGNRVEFWR